MNTIALEFVPSSVTAGPAGTVEEAKKAKRLMEKTGLADCINSIFIPHLTEEGEDRPVSLEEKFASIHAGLIGFLALFFSHKTAPLSRNSDGNH
jgi:hypothetical protein